MVKLFLTSLGSGSQSRPHLTLAVDCFEATYHELIPPLLSASSIAGCCYILLLTASASSYGQSLMAMMMHLCSMIPSCKISAGAAVQATFALCHWRSARPQRHDYGSHWRRTAVAVTRCRKRWSLMRAFRRFQGRKPLKGAVPLVSCPCPGQICIAPRCRLREREVEVVTVMPFQYRTQSVIDRVCRRHW